MRLRDRRMQQLEIQRSHSEDESNWKLRVRLQKYEQVIGVDVAQERLSLPIWEFQRMHRLLRCLIAAEVAKTLTLAELLRGRSSATRVLAAVVEREWRPTSALRSQAPAVTAAMGRQLVNKSDVEVHSDEEAQCQGFGTRFARRLFRC